MRADHRLDDVRGVVIGGHGCAWQVVYDVRPQSGKEYAESEEEAMAAGLARVAALRAEWCGYPCYLYPAELWEIRLWA